MLIFGIIVIVLFSLLVWMWCKGVHHEDVMMDSIKYEAVDLNDVYNVVSKHRKAIVNSYDMSTILAMVLGMVIGFGIPCLAIKDAPSALDVYRGKTELKIKTEHTIKDSIIVSTPIDSVVIWKEK